MGQHLLEDNSRKSAWLEWFWWNQQRVLERGNQNIQKMEALFLHFWEKKSTEFPFPNVSGKTKESLAKKYPADWNGQEAPKHYGKIPTRSKMSLLTQTPEKEGLETRLAGNFQPDQFRAFFPWAIPWKFLYFDHPWFFVLLSNTTEAGWGIWVPQSFPDAKNSLKNPKTTEYSELESIHEDHWIQLLNCPQGD